jgi:hypothetical protein
MSTLSRVNAVHHPHSKVENYKIGLESRLLPYCLFAIAGFACNGPVILLSQPPAELPLMGDEVWSGGRRLSPCSGGFVLATL